MADNVTVDNGVLTDYVVASDEVAVAGSQPTAEVQWVKLADGRVNGTDPIGGDAANGLDVDVTRVSGNVAVTGPLTDAQLRAAVVPVSGPVTDAQLRATPVPVSGTVTASGPVTDAQLRATPVPVTIPTPTPVTDNAGSLTVDAPVATPVAMRLSDGAAFYKTNVDTQLPAALVSGRLSVDASGVAVPVTDNAGSLTVDAPGLPTTLGQKTMANSLGVVVASDQTVIPVSDNAGSLTMDAPVGTPVFMRLSDGAAALVGQKVMASSLPVVLASDQTVIPVNGDIDHDAANTLKNIQVAGHASASDNPPTVVSAVGDRVRAWFDRSGAQVVRRRKIRESYTAVFRLAETAARLDQSFTHTGNTDKQWATLHHTAAATKQLQLQLVACWITSAITVAPQGIIEVRELTAATTPTTGNPAITPRAHYIGAAASEAVALYLPTTAGSEAAVNSPLGHHVFDEGVSVATTAFAHPQGFGRGGILLYDASLEDDQVMAPTAPVGVYGGWAVVARLVGATAVRMTVMMKFTEEIP